MKAPTLLRDLHWTPLEGPGMYVDCMDETVQTCQDIIYYI